MKVPISIQIVTMSVSRNASKIFTSASNNGKTLKPVLEIVQRYKKWRHLIDHITYYWSTFVSHCKRYYVPFELLYVEWYCDLEIGLKVSQGL